MKFQGDSIRHCIVSNYCIIPFFSGYNSGEQYDTISTGYMSGEAYELPDTRMELPQPSMDVIEECLVPLDATPNEDSDAANIFVLPMANNDNQHKRC